MVFFEFFKDFCLIFNLLKFLFDFYFVEIRIFNQKVRNCFVCCLLFVGYGLPGILLYGLGGLVCCCLLFVGYGRFRLYLLFHKRLMAKLFGEYLSFFQFPFILVARLK